VAEVEFSNFTATGMLRQASFKGLREDKLARSVVVEPAPGLAKNKKEKKMVRASLRAASPKIKSGADPEVAGVRLSNPDKQLWPASKTTKPVTKLALAQFYESIASRILPHLEGRPLSVVRAPDGIGGQHFFQRHALVGPFGAIKVKGETKPFLMVDSEESLVALAQAGVLEMHPWGSKKGEPETPDRLIFDLDPAPDVKFDQVIAAAKELRERLAALGLKPFVKTTGGKGLHVVTPIKGSPRHKLDWPTAKNFTQAVCKLMERDDPSLYTTTLSKKARGGKIFLDYLRNDHFATAVAPWSPRARLGAPVAMPLEWSKLRAGLDPARFHVGNAASWLKNGDPWKDLGRAAMPLEAAIRKLTRK
jgi:bifunctional non-homologous end joining protein LigD